MHGHSSPRRFVLCYVLAMFGAFIAFVPLGTLILPQKIAIITGVADRGGQVRALSWLLVAGGTMAGMGNIAAGYISDRVYRTRGSRRHMIAIGLLAVVLALAALAAAQSFDTLMLAMLVFQLALNMLLSPLVALTVDYVPDRRKGEMSGWLGLALPVGSLSVTALVAIGSIGSVGQLAVESVTVLVFVAPLLWLWPVPERICHTSTIANDERGPQRAPGLVRNFAWAWVARLLIQFAAAAILPYLYFYVAEIARPGASTAMVADGVGILALVFAAASIVGALGVGWLSDWLNRRRPLLVATSVTVAVSMMLLIMATSWPLTVIAYALFAAGLAGFLAVDSALVAQLVSATGRRATLLGVMNLTNTLPSIMAPAATLFVISDRVGAIGMLIVLKIGAAAAVIAACCGSRIRVPLR